MHSHNGVKIVNVPVTVVTVTVTETQILVPKRFELRRWEANEIPLGAKFKRWDKDEGQRIVGYNPSFGCIHYPAILLSGGKYPNHDNHYYLGDLVTSLSEPEYSFDGIEWFRCGVWEEVK